MLRVLTLRWRLAILLTLTISLAPQGGHAQTPIATAADPLVDPVVRGAWLYEGNCVRCHGEYGVERVGRNLDADELEEQIAGSVRGGCQVDWARSEGGPLSNREISALVAYIHAWEAAGAPLSLPPLPPQPTATPRPTPTVPSTAQPATPAPTPTPTVAPEIAAILAQDPVYAGAWLYSQQCARCHLSYAYSRMGKGKPAEEVANTIAEGKTGTNMPVFSVRRGGNLKTHEIDAIVAFISAWEAADAPPQLPSTLAAAVLTATGGTMMPHGGNPARGADLFAQHCAVCHGPAGDGLVGPPLAKAWSVAQPELVIRSTIVGGRPGTAMIAWSADLGGPLATQEIEDLVAHLMTWAQDPAVARQISATLTETESSLLAAAPPPSRPQSPDSTRRTTGDPARGLAGLLGFAGAVALLFVYRRWRRGSD